MDRGSWRATVHGVTESQAPLATNIHTHTHTHTHTQRQLLVPPRPTSSLRPTPWLPSRNVSTVWPDWVFPGKKMRKKARNDKN